MTPASQFGVLLSVAYDGTPFAGFARQPNVRTVSGELDGAVRAIDPNASLVRGSSRTDAGVHARAQPVAFDTRKEIDPRGWVLGLARHLPEEIAVMRAAKVDFGYDPRRHAREKTYCYRVLESPVRDPWHANRAWRVGERLNHEAMQTEALLLLGEHDFRAFRAAADERESTVRSIERAEISRSAADPRLLEIRVTGNRFMYKMMRIIVGTLVDIGRGRLEPGAIRRAQQSGARESLGMTAPPEGLCLESVVLDDPGRDPWPNQSPAELTEP